MDKESVKLDVAKLIASNPVSNPLPPSIIRSAGRRYCESGGQRHRELRAECGDTESFYDPKGKVHHISGHLKRYCRLYVREHQN